MARELKMNKVLKYSLYTYIFFTECLIFAQPSMQGKFRFGVWLQDPLGTFINQVTGQAVNSAEGFAALGITDWVGIYHWPSETIRFPGYNALAAQKLKDLNFNVIAGEDQSAIDWNNMNPQFQTTFTGYLVGDEPDMNKPTAWNPGGNVADLPDNFMERARILRQNDGTREVYANFGKPFSKIPVVYLPTGASLQEDFDKYTRYLTIASSDLYGITDPYELTPAGPNIGHVGVWTYGEAVKTMRYHIANSAYNTNSTLPNWGFIETGDPWTDSAHVRVGLYPNMQPNLIKPAVWNMIVNGASGVIYFVHDLFPGVSAANTFNPLANPTTYAAVLDANNSVNAYAAVLNTPMLSGLSGTTDASVDVAARMHQFNGDTIIFAQGHGSEPHIFGQALNATFTVPTGGTKSVEVLGESRTITMVNGVFTDHFNPYELHIYKILSSIVCSGNQVNAGPDQFVCNPNDARLIATNADSYTWSPSIHLSATTGSSPTLTLPAEDGLYTYAVTGTHPGCPNTTDQIVINVSAPSTVNAGSDQFVCDPNNATLLATGANSYTWSPATYLSTTTGFSPTITLPTGLGSYTYTVRGTHGICPNTTDQIVINVSAPSTVNAGADQFVCDPNNATLLATGANSYTWSPAAYLSATTGSSPTITLPTGLGSYTYTVRGTHGICPNTTDQIVINVFNAITVNAGEDISICTGEGATLTASGGVNYTWSSEGSLNSETRAVVIVNPSASIVYSVTSVSGVCVSSDDVIITVIPTPSINTNPDVSVCNGDEVSLVVGNFGNSYNWIPIFNGILSQVQATNEIILNIVPTISTSLIISSTNGVCTKTDTVMVNVYSPPDISMIELGPNITLCEGNPVIISAANVEGARYKWSNGATTHSIEVASSGITSTTVTSCGNNILLDSLSISFVSPPIVNLGNDSILCVGSSLTIDLENTDYSIIWSTGLESPSITVYESGVLSVIVSDGVCKEASDSIMLTFVDTPHVNLGNDTSFCLPSIFSMPTFNFSIDAEHTSYFWFDGSTTSSFSSNKDGLIWVQATNICGTVSDSVTINILHPVEFSLGNDSSFCFIQEPIFLTGPQGSNLSYLWNTGNTTSFISTFDDGLFWLEVTSSDNICKQRDSILLSNNCPIHTFIPNSFSPNGDGVNDMFTPVFNQVLADYRLLIYNRWGEKVFHTENQFIGWDGKYKDENVSEELYSFSITSSSLEKSPIMGSIFLVK